MRNSREESSPSLNCQRKTRPSQTVSARWLQTRAGGSALNRVRLWRRGKKEVCFHLLPAGQKVRALALDIFTHKLGRKPVCSLAEKLQLKMYDFGLPERRQKSALGLCKYLEQRR